MATSDHEYARMGSRILYITHEEDAHAAELRQAVGTEGTVKVLSRAQVTGKLAEVASASFDVVVSVGTSAADHHDDLLFELARVLKPTGNLVLREPLLVGPQEGAAAGGLRTQKDVESALLIAGFSSTTIKTPQSGNAFEIRAVKPNWELGAAAAVSLPKTKAPSSSVWSLSADDTLDDGIPVVKAAAPGTTWKLDSDDADLIEDEALLEKEDLVKPTKVFDCGTSASGKRKACKNCSCGLAEELETEGGKEIKKKTPEQASACGNCALGDAFRCASCPYLGLPAFKPGEKISLANMD